MRQGEDAIEVRTQPHVVDTCDLNGVVDVVCDIVHGANRMIAALLAEE